MVASERPCSERAKDAVRTRRSCITMHAFCILSKAYAAMAERAGMSLEAAAGPPDLLVHNCCALGI